MGCRSLERKEKDLATRLASFKHTKENMPSVNKDSSTVDPKDISPLFMDLSL